MRLKSLGGLELEGSKFRREKPLLLLAYLALEGPKPRRFAAELFWPEAPNPMNNLAVALNHLRKLGAAQADEQRVWAGLGCDAAELREHLRAGRTREAFGLYRGAFAEGLDLGEAGPELEEWVWETRESLARELRAALLWQAEEEARLARFAEAGRLAEAAYRLPGCPPPEPEELPRLHRLLRAAEHPACEAVEREARELGLRLESTPETARGRLKPGLIGRGAELERLGRLEPGQWAWVRGGPGMGKTTLLRELALRHGGRYLPGRSGLPYATLEPLLGDLEGSETALLRRLARAAEPLLLDGWEAADPESRQLLSRLHALRPDFAVVLAGQGEAPLPVDLRLELGPLTAPDLAGHPGAFEATGGIPALVGAFSRGEPLEEALEARLLRLGPAEREVYAALALLPSPDLGTVRQALGLEAATLVRAHETLLDMGLVEASGAVRGQGVALRHLEGEPALAQRLSLALARLLPDPQALPLYRRARALWEPADLPKVRRAFHHWAQELLRRGFPKRAVELLEDSPPSPETALLRARALERSSLFRQALDLLEGLEPTPQTQALTSRLLFKLGYPDEARRAAEAALGGPLEAEAEALNTLGEIALRRGQAQEALELFSRAATLWQAAGQRSRWLWALNNRAVARSVLGGYVEEAFAEVMQAAEEDPSAQAMVLFNVGQGHLNRRELPQAERAFLRAIDLALESGALTPAALAWNGLGVIRHGGQPANARQAYTKALELAQQAGDAQLTAIALANLAELEGNIPAWEQAVELLERSGFLAMAREVRATMETFMRR